MFLGDEDVGELLCDAPQRFILALQVFIDEVAAMEPKQGVRGLLVIDLHGGNDQGIRLGRLDWHAHC